MNIHECVCLDQTSSDTNLPPLGETLGGLSLFKAALSMTDLDRLETVLAVRLLFLIMASAFVDKEAMGLLPTCDLLLGGSVASICEECCIIEFCSAADGAPRIGPLPNLYNVMFYQKYKSQ
jgi:hypothetical protein